MVKDADEIGKLAVACRLTDAAFAEVALQIRPGMSERMLATRLDHAMTRGGAERPAFDTIVAAGPNGAIPHHVPAGRELERGDLVTMDFGALYEGYHADMTRTVAIGAAADWQRDIYELVALAQRAGVAALADGVEAGAVDAAAREVIEAAGHAGHFKHGLGHGVGLEIHEAPMLGYGRTARLTDRVPVTIEPGVYLPAAGGVRIEDVLLVTAGGSARSLTSTSRELLIL
jgi:Xaa-Pro aminopeptidase